MTEDILKLKSFLLNPKRSDEFVTWYYLDGWRFCTIKVGSKKASVTPKFGKGKITLSIRKLKEELNILYWYAARCDASRIAKEEGRKKKKLRWEENYA